MKKFATVLLIGFLSIYTVTAQKRESFLSPEEILWLEKNKSEITYAPNIFWPPADYIDDRGIHKGIVADYIQLIENRLEISFRKVYFKNWSDIVSGLESSEVDFVGGIHETKARSRFLNFTDFYLSIPLVILTQNEYPDISSESEINTMNLACAADYASLEYIKNTYPKADLFECQNDLEAILKSSLGNTDGTVIDLMTASFLVEKYGINNLKFATELDFKWHLRIGVRKDLPELQSILNKTLKSISSEERAAIYKKWININHSPEPSFLEKHLKLISYLLIITLSLFLIITGIGLYLKQQVKKRTSELSNELKAREKAELSLAESERKFREIFDSTGEAIFIQAPESGTILNCNEQAVKMYGFGSKEEIRNVDVAALSALTEGFDEKAIRNNTMRAFQEGEHNFDWLARKKNGEYFWAAVHLKKAVINEENRIIAVVRNINERKRYEQELYKAKKKAEENDNLKTAFLNNLSHEIRTPLNAVCGFSSFLSDEKLSDKERKQYVNIIQNSSNQLLSIVSDVLTASSLETKQEKARPEPVCINTLIDELFATFKQQNKKNNIRLKVQKPKDDKRFEIYTDKLKLRRVITNLLDNAFKFTEQGSVEFGYRLIGNDSVQELEFFVKDTGIGIKKEMQKKIFERFRKGDFKDEKIYDGTGLGLSISKGFVELLGGKIWLESEPGVGSAFFFTLPYKHSETNHN